MINLSLIICLLLALANHNMVIYVHAFAATSRQQTKTNASNGFGGTKRTTKKQKKKEKGISVEDNKDTLVSSSFNDVVEETCNRIYSVCREVQKSPIYQPPRWADLCSIEGETVIANAKVKRGQILTLYPIDALVLQNDERQILKCYQDRENGVLNEQDKQEVSLDEDEPLYHILSGGAPNSKLFLMRSCNKEVVPGWLGGNINTTTFDTEDSNCIIIPLPGAAPFCAAVASKDIDAGNELIRNIRPLDLGILDELRSIVAKEYSRNVSMLRLQVETVCEMKFNINPTKDNEPILGPFHNIDLQYPGLRQIHNNPDIYEVKGFLTIDECDRIISKARPHLFQCFVGDANGKSVQDPWRTNTVANLPRAEVPSIVKKITKLSCCNEEQLETLQVLNYKNGQQFKQHTDGMSGPITASGFEQSTRLATVFCYLNDVSEGGSTRFPKIDLEIKPTKGTAVIHFPVDLNMREDTRTLHQGSPALDEKWLLTTWVWKTKRVDHAFSESKLISLSNDII